MHNSQEPHITVEKNVDFPKGYRPVNVAANMVTAAVDAAIMVDVFDDPGAISGCDTFNTLFIGTL